MSVTEEQNCPKNDTVYMGLAAEVMGSGHGVRKRHMSVV
jgi:hypothetical protein